MFVLKTINSLRNLRASVISSMRFYSFADESDMQLVLKNISSILSCSEKTALTVYQTFPSARSMAAMTRMDQNVKLLTSYGVSKQLIGDNLLLLNLKIGTDAFQRKLEIIKQMQPRDVNDFVPLLDIQESVLRNIAAMAAVEYDVITERHRIYYLSKALQIAPVTVSKYCSKFNLIFLAPFTNIAKKLNILLDYNVDGLQILQSLYIFRCSDKVFISRLEDLFANGLYDIKLRFFKLTDEQFRKVLVSEAKNGRSPSIELARKLKRRNLEKLTILSELNAMLSCDDKLSAEIYYNFIGNIDQVSLAKQNCALLIANGASLDKIRQNAVLLTLPYAQTIENIELIKGMHPKAIDDFLPLVEVGTPKLETFAHSVKESKIASHPIYFFSEKLNITPSIVSQYFVKYPDSYFTDFVSLKKKLELLVAFHVKPMSILKSGATFKLSFAALESTLKDLKSKGIEDIASWMLVCDTSRMKNIAARRVEERKLIGDSATTVEYIANRLNWDHTAKEKALKHYPGLTTCSIIRAQAHLDYLLNETHFTIDDISSCVQVFSKNPDELKLRVNELAAIGLVPCKLYLICLSTRLYLERIAKFCKKKNCALAFEKFKLIERRIKR